MSTYNKLESLGRNLCQSFTNPAMVRNPKLYSSGPSRTAPEVKIQAKPTP